MDSPLLPSSGFMSGSKSQIDQMSNLLKNQKSTGGFGSPNMLKSTDVVGRGDLLRPMEGSDGEDMFDG